MSKELTGYDGKTYVVGQRVEIHPATDQWMRGARFGTVVRTSLTPNDRVHVQLDKIGQRVAGTEDNEADAQHLAACWNAVERIGGDPEIVTALVENLRFLVDAAKTEPGMSIYRAHIEQAEMLLGIPKIERSQP